MGNRPFYLFYYNPTHIFVTCFDQSVLKKNRLNFMWTFIVASSMVYTVAVNYEVIING